MAERLPMRTVLVFAHECAPYNRPQSTAGAQRPAGWARELASHGWRAIVICRDAALEGRAHHSDRDSIREAAAKAIRDSDPSSSVIIPTASLPHDGPVDRAWRWARHRRTLRRPLTMIKLARGDHSQSWQPVARWAAEGVAAQTRVDVCVGEHSPDAGLFLARSFAAAHGVPWVADFRDPVLAPFSPSVRRLYLPIIRRTLRTAAATINVNDEWADLDRRWFSKPAHVIPNGFDPFPGASPVAPARTAPHWARRSVVYIGSIQAWAPMEVFLEGLASAVRKEPGQVVFRYRGLAAARLASRVEQLGLGDAADIDDWCPRDEALALLQQADWLLLLPRRDPDRYRAHGCLPAKAFEYLGARRPILCPVGDGGMLDHFLRETRTGVVAPTAHDIASTVLSTPPDYEPDERQVQRYDRRVLAGELARVLESVI